MNRPPNRPTCKHGNTPGRCNDCNRETIRIQNEIRPLENLFWEEHGKNCGDLQHLLVRAYSMGMEHTENKMVSGAGE